MWPPLRCHGSEVEPYTTCCSLIMSSCDYWTISHSQHSCGWGDQKPMIRTLPANQGQPLILIHHGHTEFTRLVQFGARTGASNEIVRLL